MTPLPDPIRALAGTVTWTMRDGSPCWCGIRPEENDWQDEDFQPVTPVHDVRCADGRAALRALGARAEAEKPKCGELDLSGEIACHRAAGHTGFHEGKPPVVTFGVNMTLRGGA